MTNPCLTPKVVARLASSNVSGSLWPSTGDVGILVGSHRYIGHEALEVGFRSYLREFASGIPVRDSRIYLDDRAVAYEAATELLQTSPDLKGIYHCGGGVSGVLRALEQSGRGHEISYICHEASPVTRDALRAGLVDLVLATPVETLAHEAIDLMAKSTLGPVGDGGTGVNRILKFEVLTPENC